MRFEQKRQELQRLVDLFLEVVERSEGIKAADWQLTVNQIAIKYLCHLLSILHLVKGTHIDHFEKSFVDCASIQVLSRAAFENFLVFHYLIIDPHDEDMRELRLLAWKYAEDVEFAKLGYETEAILKQKKANVPKIERLKKEIKGNPVFVGLNQAQQKNIIKGKWKPDWKSIANAAGMTGSWVMSLYRLLCGHAHTDYGSITRLHHRNQDQRVEALLPSTIGLLNSTTAHFIHHYCRLFPRCQSILEAKPEEVKVAMTWKELGTRDETDLSSI